MVYDKNIFNGITVSPQRLKVEWVTRWMIYNLKLSVGYRGRAQMSRQMGGFRIINNSKFFVRFRTKGINCGRLVFPI